MLDISRRSRRLVGSLRVQGRCFTCLMHEELFSVFHPKSGRRIYLCEYCKIDQELKEAFEQRVFSERSSLRM